MTDRIKHLEGELLKLKRIMIERKQVIKDVKELKDKVEKLEKLEKENDKP